MFWKLLILMYLCHVVGVFFVETYLLKRINSGKTVRLTYSFTWSGLILLPIMILLSTSGLSLFCMFIINGLLFFVLNDLYLEEQKLTFETAQRINFLQIFFTLLMFYFIL